MVFDGTTACFAIVRSLKEKKNLREICEYLSTNKIDRTRILRRVGNVLVVDIQTLEQGMETRAGQRSQKGSVIGYCSCGAAYPPRVKCGGDREARRQKQRANRGRSRDNRTISSALARVLNPLQGGSASRTTEIPSKLQLLQQFAVARSEEGKQIWSKKDHAIYVGISNPTNRLAEDGEKNENKNGEKRKKEIKIRKIEDRLLLVVAARIYGKQVRALIDSGATRCFVTPACVKAVGLKGTSLRYFPGTRKWREIPIQGVRS